MSSAAEYPARLRNELPQQSFCCQYDFAAVNRSIASPPVNTAISPQSRSALSYRNLTRLGIKISRVITHADVSISAKYIFPLSRNGGASYKKLQLNPYYTCKPPLRNPSSFHQKRKETEISTLKSGPSSRGKIVYSSHSPENDPYFLKASIISPSVAVFPPATK